VLGLDYKLEENRPPSPELVETTRASFQAAGLRAF